MVDNLWVFLRLKFIFNRLWINLNLLLGFVDSFHSLFHSDLSPFLRDLHTFTQTHSPYYDYGGN